MTTTTRTTKAVSYDYETVMKTPPSLKPQNLYSSKDLFKLNRPNPWLVMIRFAPLDVYHGHTWGTTMFEGERVVLPFWGEGEEWRTVGFEIKVNIAREYLFDQLKYHSIMWKIVFTRLQTIENKRGEGGRMLIDTRGPGELMIKAYFKHVCKDDGEVVESRCIPTTEKIPAYYTGIIELHLRQYQFWANIGRFKNHDAMMDNHNEAMMKYLEKKWDLFGQAQHETDSKLSQKTVKMMRWYADNIRVFKAGTTEEEGKEWEEF